MVTGKTIKITGVLMEHPPKQGLKPNSFNVSIDKPFSVLMEHPPKQGLKPHNERKKQPRSRSFNGTSTKTRIETAYVMHPFLSFDRIVLMEHPPKQGLKLNPNEILSLIEAVLMEHPPKQGLKLTLRSRFVI